MPDQSHNDPCLRAAEAAQRESYTRAAEAVRVEARRLRKEAQALIERADSLESLAFEMLGMLRDADGRRGPNDS